jgi:hypothetical protein
VLILLDCCAGAASATFPSGQSITETISASSWDAIAPHPGRYSFTSALIEVLQEWRMRTFSAAMLHAEVLARLKHPRPETINGKYYEARSTPVHFMMTSNHKAASIELTPIVPDNKRPPSPPQDSPELPNAVLAGRAPGETEVAEPNEDEPHVMISLALEDNQRLDLNAWEQWLSSFPALAKYVKVQGVFKSHSTLLLLSVPVMIWDLLPEDRACSFVAFIRSNNLLAKKSQAQAQEAVVPDVAAVESTEAEQLDLDTQSVLTGTTFLPGEEASLLSPNDLPLGSRRTLLPSPRQTQSASTESLPGLNRSRLLVDGMNNNRIPVNARAEGSTVSLGSLQRQHSAPTKQSGGTISHQPTLQHPIINTSRSQRRVGYASERDVPSGPPLAAHVVARAEQYYQRTPNPSVAESENYASNLGIEKKDLDRWFHYRRLRDVTTSNLQNLKMEDNPPDLGDGIRMVLPHHLSRLLDIMLPDQALVLDLRSRTAFTKSHIYKAVNFRLPSYFIESAEAELIGQALADQEQHDVARWMNAACIIFYDRAVEYSWESPTAETLVTKFRRKGWSGQGFVLKGHYREFASSYEKYIVTSSDDGHTKALDASLKYSVSFSYLGTSELKADLTQNNDDWRAQQREYQEWLHVLETSDRVHTTELAPPQKQERLDAVAERERDMDSEFMDRHPQLYKEAQKLRPAAQDGADEQFATSAKGKDIDINLDAQANLVAPLARSLAKMQDASNSSASASRAASPEMRRQYVDKLGEVAAAAEDYEPSSAQDQQNTSLMRSGSVASEGAAPSDGRAESREERPFWKRKKSAKSVKEMGSSSWSLRK